MIQFTQIKNDGNGNPRLVYHFLNLLTDEQRDNREGSDFIERRYNEALANAKALGGRKFHNKQYGGGIVFPLGCEVELNKRIAELLAKT